MSADFEATLLKANSAQTAEILAAVKQEIAKIQLEAHQGSLATQALCNEIAVSLGQAQAAINALTATVAGSARTTKKVADVGAAPAEGAASAPATAENKFPATILFWFNANMKSPEFAAQILSKMEATFPTEGIKEQMDKSFAANPIPNRVKHDSDFLYKYLKNNSKAGAGKKLSDELRDTYNAAKKEHTDKLQTGSVEQKIEASTPV